MIQAGYPAAVIGSSSGALAHLAAALGAPFLPQTFLLPVGELLGVDPDRFPQDFASFVRFHRQLRGLRPQAPPPGALTVPELDWFLGDSV